MAKINYCETDSESEDDIELFEQGELFDDEDEDDEISIEDDDIDYFRIKTKENDDNEGYYINLTNHFSCY